MDIRFAVEIFLQKAQPVSSTHFFHRRWPVFFEDNHVLSLYKPAGLLMQGDRTGAPCLLDLARSWIKERYAKPGRVFLGLVHRLDRPVAGIVLFARTSKAASRLSAQIREGRVRKMYLAVLEGSPDAASGDLLHFIEPGKRASRIVDHPRGDARKARLAFEVLENACGHTLVKIDLQTGRKHQIRLQFAEIGCPVLGDVRYGASAPLGSRQIALFSREVSFLHPTRQEKITLSAPLPKGWPWHRATPEGEAPYWSWKDFPSPATFG